MHRIQEYYGEAMSIDSDTDFSQSRNSQKDQFNLSKIEASNPESR